MEERLNPIVIEDSNGLQYTLEFNRATVKQAERKGFRLENLAGGTINEVENFFFYAFNMHHPGMNKNDTDKILWDELGGIDGLSEEFVSRLVGLYSQTYSSLASPKAKVTLL